jgi:RES domain-containing protein
MCGICGIVDFTGAADRGTVERMSGLLRHRGHDDSGLEVSGPAALGMSVAVPEERNLLLNPAHADFRRIRIGEPRPFHLDARVEP